ncbi:MAG: hypothetical protein ACC618_03735 [Patescibacteria group bacterium]
MNIEGITASEIPNSRGEKTIEVSVKNKSGSFSAQLPSGKSRGKKEAVVLGAKSAKNILKSGLEKEITQKEFNTISDLDKFLIEYDGTENKSKIGGDLSLGISISFARALADEREIKLWEVLKGEFFDNTVESDPPKIFFNMINGGAHADTNLNIQEYQIVGVIGEGVTSTINELKSLYTKLGVLLSRKFGSERISFGDEQGYATDFRNNFEPLEILNELLYESVYKKEFTLGIDAAASSFYNGKNYRCDEEEINTDKLHDAYAKYFKECDSLEYIEDPFAQDDEKGFKKVFENFGNEKVLIGDDLTTTDAKLIKKYAGNAINGVIIKPNQIGTVTETCEAMLIAEENNIQRIVSHRSGEVEDPFIIHFAKAAGAEGVKIGVPVIKERISKFDELVRLYS